MTVPAVADAPISSPPVRSVTRLVSIDVLRGLDVLLMLFVNEMAGVEGTPRFLLHTPAQLDGMTLTDTVFPAFLFITGMAIPLALGTRLVRGESRGSLWRHVFVRSLSLIVLGVFMVNAEHEPVAGVLSPHAWSVLMTLAAFAVWQAPRPDAPRWSAARLGGLVVLLLLAVTYRGAGMTGLLQMRPQWWGILGLIGWAYLVSATAFLLVGPRPAWLFGGSMALYGLFFLDQTGVIPALNGIRPLVNIGPVLGSHAALVLSGTALVAWFLRARDRSVSIVGLVPRVALYGTVLIAAGVFLHQFRDVSRVFWIHKGMATPAWCLISAGCTALGWAVLLVLVEGRGWRRWPAAVTIAGQDALLCYLLAPLLASVLVLSAPLFGGENPYATLGGSLLWGTVRSIVFAWVLVLLAGWLRGRGLRLQL